MNADRLMEHFERISDAPDAVGRLRRFILDLAVRGKLVEQDPGESAEASKAAAAEEPFPLPSNWSCVALGGVLHMINGRAFKPSEWLTKGLPIVRIQNLNNESAPFNSCDPKGVDEKNIINTGTFLISWSGTPGTSFGAFIWQRGKAALNQHIFKCLPTGTEYLGRFLQLAINGRLDEMIAKAHGGVGLQHITKGKLEALALPLPPLAEQHRIVEKVDELMKLCDRLESSQKERESRRDRLVVASLNRLSQPTDPDEFKKDARFQLSNLNRLSTRPKHIKEIRKAILNLAVRGKLVPQDDREGTAANSLRTLGLHPADPPPDSEDGVLPPSWCMIRFDDVATISGGVTLGRKLGGRKTALVPYLRVANVQRGGFDLSVIKEVDVPVEEVEKYSLKENDLLMTEGGDWDKVGRSAIWRNQIPLCLHQNHVFRARMNSPEISPVWFERYFNSPAGRAYFESCSKQTTNLASINMRQVRGCPVPLPPLAEQKRIVAKVDELMLICDQLETQLAYQQKGRRQLLEALLHEALEGVG